MIVTLDTDKPEDLAALVAIALGAVEKKTNLHMDAAYICSITDRKQRRAELAEFNRR